MRGHLIIGYYKIFPKRKTTRLVYFENDCLQNIRGIKLINESNKDLCISQTLTNISDNVHRHSVLNVISNAVIPWYILGKRAAGECAAADSSEAATTVKGAPR